MKIRKRLNLNTWITVLAAAAVLCSFLWAYSEIYRADRHEDLAKELKEMVIEQSMPQEDYLLLREEKGLEQWKARFETLRPLLKDAKGQLVRKGDRDLLEKAQGEFDEAASLFTKAVEMHKQREHVRGAAVTFAAESKLIDQLFQKMNTLQKDIGSLEESAEDASRSARNRGFVLVLVFVICGGAATVFNSALLNRVIRQRLDSLLEGIEKIGAGNVDYLLDTGGGDELSDLARRGNEMVARLRESQTYIENLRREISLREETDERLRAANVLLKAVIDSSSLAIIVLDENEKIKVWNPATEAMLGWSERETIGGALPCLPEDRKEDSKNIRALVRQGKIVTGHRTQRLKKDGSIIDVSLSVSPLTDVDGKISGMMAIVQDITDHLRAETRLLENEERYRSLFENMLDGYAYCKMIFEDGVPQDFIYLEVNHAFEGLTGLKNVIGKRVTEVIPGIREVEPELFEIYGRVALTGRPERFETYIKPLEIWLSVSAYSTESEHFIAVFDNSTARKKAEEDLRRSEEFNREIISNANEGIVVYDRDFRYRAWNRYMENLTGISESEVIGRCAFDLFPHLREYEVDRLLERALVGEVVVSPDVPYNVLQTGKTGWVTSRYGPQRNAEGDIVGVIGMVNDITERKLVEEELKESEKKYSDLAHSIPQIIFELDVEGRLTFVNRTALIMTDYSQEELYEMDVSQVIVPEDRIRARSNIKKRFAGEHVTGNEYSILRKDGSTFPVNIYSVPIVRDSQVVGLRGVVIDITERKRAEDALRLANERFRRIVESNIVGIVIADAAGRIIEANDYYLNLIGYTRKELDEGKVDWRAVTPPECMILDEKAISELRQTGVCTPYEKEYVRRDGTRFHVFLADTLLPGPEEEIAAFVLDLSEMKAHEREIERLNRLYAALSGINKMIGNVSSREELFEEVCRILAAHADFKLVWIGWTDPETRKVEPVARAGKDAGYLDKISVYADDRPEGHGPVGTSIQTGNPSIFNDFVNEARALPWRDAASAFGLRAVVAFPIRLNGETCGAIAVYADEINIFQDKEVTLLEEVARDISFTLDNLERQVQHEQTKEMLIQAEKLAAIGRLSAGVGHEILNPVNIISMRIQMLEMAEGLPKKVRDGFAQMKNQIDRIVKITKDLSQFSRITKRNIVAGNLNQLVEHILHLVIPRLHYEQIALETKLGIDLPEIMMEAGRIEQVVLNLVNNAVDALEGRERKTLQVATERVDRDGKRYARIAVSDNGNGIPPGDMNILFEPFFTTKELGRGTGLGLYICYNIIQEHKGRIWAENNAMGGASFYVELPTARDEVGR